MTDQISPRDPNRVVTLLGVDSTLFEDTTTVAVDPITHEMFVRATIKETPPTDSTKNNSSVTLGYDASGNLTSIAKVISGTTYTKTFTWTDGLLTNISVWV